MTRPASTLAPGCLQHQCPCPTAHLDRLPPTFILVDQQDLTPTLPLLPFGQEVYFTLKRQQFLIDQGYSYKVIPALLEAAGAAGAAGLPLEARAAQLEQLAALLAAGEAELAIAEEGPGADEADGLTAGRPAARRTVGSMAALSGAAGVHYLEYSTQHAAQQAQQRRPPRSKFGGGKLAKLARG